MASRLQLILYQAHANLREETRRTHGGMLWWFVEPVLHMVIYYFVFAVVFQRGTEDFVPFLLIGLVVWRWFQVSFMQGSTSIIQNQRLMQQLYLPKGIFPSVSILTNVCKFGFTLAILLGFLWAYGLLPGVHYMALPLVLGVQLVFIMGCVYVAAAILPFVPDVKIILENALRALMFLSGIFYSGQMVPEHLQFYFYLNPMAVMIEAFRDVLLHAQWPDLGQLGYVLALGLLGMAVGTRLIRRFDFSYPKVLG